MELIYPNDCALSELNEVFYPLSRAEVKLITQYRIGKYLEVAIGEAMTEQWVRKLDREVNELFCSNGLYATLTMNWDNHSIDVKVEGEYK